MRSFWKGTVIAAAVALTCTHSMAQIEQQAIGKHVGGAAVTPPMGWNSYDYFGAAVVESEFKAEVDFMKAELLEYGWNYAVVDYLWFNPTGGTSVHPDASGRPADTLAMDPFGRLLPAINRFPSAANGVGFRGIAEYVHAKGMKFGIHIMRGIPRQAYWENRPILGTRFTARDVADTAKKSLCDWNNNMYGVNPAASGAQEYYNSIVDLYASWGVDFLKVDDIAAPPYRESEIELIRRAIDRCGRPIVLSLSPGETPIGSARAVSRQATMWRISNDMWDSWKSLVHQVELLGAWYPLSGENHWPDADMLPIGHLSRNGKVDGPDRISRLTVDETTTLMSLWCIARSPLIMGGDLLTSPAWVMALMKNRDVIELDQHSRNNRQAARDEVHTIWTADGNGVKYVALVNLDGTASTVVYSFAEQPGWSSKYRVTDLWSHRDEGIAVNAVSVPLAPHASRLFKLEPLP